MSRILHTDGNWVLEQDTVLSDPKVYTHIKHTTCSKYGAYRHGAFIDMPCSDCKEAAPEGLIALYHLMVWDE